MKILTSLLCLVALVIVLAGCQNKTTEHRLKVAATSVPHAELLELVKPDLKAQGIDLEIIVVEDFNTPNRALADKEVDANFFQHTPYLETQMNEFGYKLEGYARIHLEPMGLYSKKVKALTEIAVKGKIALPSDPTNQARALHLLEKAGLIRLNRNDTQASLLNITDNPKQLEILELDSALLSRALEDVDAAAMSTNFALQAGLSPLKDTLSIESQDSAFVNILAIRAGEGEREDLQALKKALTGEKVARFIEQHYQGAIVPVGE